MAPDPFNVIVFVAIFVVHCSLLGAGLLPAAVCQSTALHVASSYLRWFFALCLGMFANMALLFALGMAGRFVPAAVLVVAAAALVLVAPRLRRNVLHAGLTFRRQAGSTFLHVGAWLALGLMFVLCIVQAFRPPGHFDDTMYHLPLARSYIEHQGIVLQEYLRFPLFPQNMNLLFAVGLMFGGEVAAQALAILPVFVMAFGALAALAYATGSLHFGILAAALLPMTGPTKRMLAFAYVDNGLGMFCWAATFALALWAGSKDIREKQGWLALTGVMAGAAAGIKYFGVVLAGLLGLCLFAIRQWRAGFVYGVIFVAAGCWWYVRSYVISGDPIHPAGGGFFGFYLWDAGDLAYQKAEQATHGVNKSLLHFWPALKEAHVKFWVLAFLGLFLRNVPKSVRVVQFTFVGYFLFWFFVTQVWRYLAPVYAAGAFLSCYTLYRWYVWMPKPAVLNTTRAKSIAMAVLVVALAGYAYERMAGVNDQLKSWDATLAKTSGYTLFQAANQHIPDYGSRLVQLSFEHRVYFFEGTVIGDVFGPGRYRDMLDCSVAPCSLPSPRDMLAYLNKAGSRMLVVSFAQYPGFDVEQYSELFVVLKQTEDGVLLGVR